VEKKLQSEMFQKRKIAKEITASGETKCSRNRVNDKGITFSGKADFSLKYIRKEK